MYRNYYMQASQMADMIQSGALADQKSAQRKNQQEGLMNRISSRVEEDSGFDVTKYISNMRSTLKKEAPAVEGGSVTGMAVPDIEELPEGVTRPIDRATTPVAADASERELLAKTLHAEAVGEGYEGMLAAGTVIFNRIASGDYGGKSLKDVILKPGQFSAWNLSTGYAGGKGGINMDKIKPTKEAYAAADALLSGSRHEAVGSRTHYYAPKAANPKWGKRAGGDWLTIGNHVFGWADAGKNKR